MMRLKINEPKIVLVSNSNLAFGIQSDLIEDAFEMPVVNLGLHGGLGNAFHERMPLFNITIGDIIVISHLDYSDDDKISDSVKNIKFDNEKIIEVNDLLKDLAKDEKITYVDLYNKLIDDDGNLNISYTKDGLHISSEGYECITKELMKYIKD